VQVLGYRDMPKDDPSRPADYFDTPPDKDITVCCIVGIKDPVRKEVRFVLQVLFAHVFVPVFSCAWSLETTFILPSTLRVTVESWMNPKVVLPWRVLISEQCPVKR
jgi:hypothetical protein